MLGRSRSSGVQGVFCICEVEKGPKCAARASELADKSSESKIATTSGDAGFGVEENEKMHDYMKKL